jgi:hypothetical protein
VCRGEEQENRLRYDKTLTVQMQVISKFEDDFKQQVCIRVVPGHVVIVQPS